MTICESCIRNKDCEWKKGNPRHCTLYTDKKETKFELITKSPEALAEFLSDTCCRLLRDVWSNDGETGEGYWQENESEWLNWLKQEAEE